jgi:hypothetical protein
MDPGFSQLAVLWEREKLSPLPLVSLLLQPKRCTGHHLGTSSYFTHVDVCFGLLITALLCKFRIDINQLI